MINYFKKVNPLVLVLLLILISGCSNDDSQTPDTAQDAQEETVAEPTEENTEETTEETTEESTEETTDETQAGLSLRLATDGDYGKILVNGENQSIYFFAGDVTGESNCNGGCADVWPALTGELSELELGEGLDYADFHTTEREDGQKQLTYKGWPLYYFSTEGDRVLEAPGETLGDGRGGLFHIAKPDYSILLGRQTVTEGEEPVVYLVDDRGVSLYTNTGDDENSSNCAGGCAGVWPPFKTPEKLVVASSLSLDDFYTNDREDDLGPQLAFQKSPLYFFSQDEGKRGSVLGQAGGPNQTFFVAEPEE